MPSNFDSIDKALNTQYDIVQVEPESTEIEVIADDKNLMLKKYRQI